MSKIINEDKLIALGHGKYFRKSGILGLMPITGFKRDLESRTRVLIDHPEKEIISGRTSETIARYMAEDEEEETGVGLIEGLGNMKTAIEKISERQKVQRTDRQIEREEYDELVIALETHNTIKEAIESLPYGSTKFYRNIKRHPRIKLELYRNRKPTEPELEI